MSVNSCGLVYVMGLELLCDVPHGGKEFPLSKINERNLLAEHSTYIKGLKLNIRVI